MERLLPEIYRIIWRLQSKGLYDDLSVKLIMNNWGVSSTYQVRYRVDFNNVDKNLVSKAKKGYRVPIK